jgi:hypothetical protein
MNPAPNKVPPQRPWTAEERQLWLIAKSAPPDVVILTQQELSLMSRQMAAAQAQLAVMDAHLRAVSDALGPFNALEPDPANAAGAARFDAERYKAAADSALPLLDRLADTLSRMAGSKFIRFVVRYDLLGLAGECEMAAKFIRDQQERRRERTPLIDPNEVIARARAPGPAKAVA